MESKIYPAEYSYFEIKRIIKELSIKYPFLNTTSIGKSAAGRDIISLSIGSEKEHVVFISGDDPSMPVTTLILLRFCEEICHCILKGKELCGLNIRRAFFGRKITFIPLLNPDGAEIRLKGTFTDGYFSFNNRRPGNEDFKNWKSNLRGVEIARNFPFNFEERKSAEKLNGIRTPGPFGFSGYTPASEAETIAFINFCTQNKINHLIHLSAFGETVSYSGIPDVPERSSQMAEIISAVSHYSICPPLGAADNYICNWFANEYLKPAFCIKIGENNIPKVFDFYNQYNKIKETLTLSSLF